MLAAIRRIGGHLPLSRQFQLLQCAQVFNIEGGDTGEPATRREVQARPSCYP